MTPLKQQISLIPFSIEHWYSPSLQATVQYYSIRHVRSDRVESR